MIQTLQSSVHGPAILSRRFIVGGMRGMIGLLVSIQGLVLLPMAAATTGLIHRSDAEPGL